LGRIVHILVRLLAGFVALAVVVLALVAARLSAGPLSLSLLTPMIERALDAATPYRFHIGDARMLWQDWRRGLLVRLNDVQVSGGEGAALASIEDVAVAFSAEAMARGVLAPSSVEATGAAITLNRGPEGLWPAPRNSGKDANRQSLVDTLAGLRSPPDVRRPLSFLFDVHLDDVAVNVEGPLPAEGLRMRVDRAQFARDQTAALQGSASLAISHAGEDAAVSLRLRSAGPDDPVDGHLDFSGLRPAAFADLAPDLAPLAAIDTALQGTISLKFASDGTLGEADVAVSGGPGALVMTKHLASVAGLATPEQRLPLRSLVVQAALVPSQAQYTVRNAEIVFEPGTMVYVPSPVDHRYPLSLLSGNGSYAKDRLSIPSLDADLGDLRLTATTTVENLSTAASGTAAVTASDIKVDDFRRYWPPKAAPGAYDWCIKHLRDGVVPQAGARLAFASRNGATEVTSLDADFGIERLTVDYLPPMPPVRGATGTARVDLKTMTIEIAGGQSAGLTIRGGTAHFPDLDRDIPSIDIDLTVAGPVRSAMNLIAHEPLAYPQKIGISPAQTSGELSARLKLGFSLLADLEVEQMHIDAAVDLTNAGVADVMKGIGISNGQVHLDIDTAGLRAAGRLAIADIDGHVDVAESFLDDAQPRTRLEFVADNVQISRLRQNFPEIAVLDSYLLGGSLDGRVRIALTDDGPGQIESTLDLSKARLAVPYLGWHKEAGPPGTIDVVMQTEGEHLAAVPRVSLTAPDMELRGSLRLRADGGIERLDIDRLASGRTDASVTIARLLDKQWDVMVSGNSVDLDPLIKAGGEGVGESGSSFCEWPEFTFAADLRSVWFGGPAPIGDVMATLVHDGGAWTLAQMQGRLSDGSIVELAVAPADGRGRTFSMSAGNAGEALRAFRIFPDMIGGQMDTEGRFDDADPAHPLRAKLRVNAYHIVGTPILARLLGLLSLGGIRAALTGRGIYFSTLDMPFEARKGVVTIDNGKAFGSALGLTFSGPIDTNTDTIDLQGQLVPFYAVNSALGRLPVLGDVMTGGEQGGGVFSASYRVAGALDDPAISVNPVSVLFPGFLRWILETFEGWIGTSVPVEEGGTESAGQR
jgi:hypothetical protein